MKINRENYELYFMDFFDGSLSKEDIALLMVFFEDNPDLKSEFDQFENISIDEGSETIFFYGKESLKKPEFATVNLINQENYQEYFVAYFEGDLDTETMNNVELFVDKNPNLKTEYEIFGKIKVQPDEEIVFDNKDSLKKKVSIHFYKSVMKYAASIAMLIGVGYLAFSTLDRLGQSELKISQNQAGIKQYAFLSERNFLQHITEEVIENEKQYYNNVSQASIKGADRITSGQSIEAIDAKALTSIQYADASNKGFSKNYRSEYLSAYSAMAERDRIYGKDEVAGDSEQGERLFDKVIRLVSGDRSETFNGWQIAEYGVKGFNLLTNNDVQFQTKNNNQGEVSKVMFDDFAVPVKRDR